MEKDKKQLSIEKLYKQMTSKEKKSTSWEKIHRSTTYSNCQN